MSELPNGWALTVLGKIGQWGSGGTPSRKIREYFGDGIPWVKSGDLPDGFIQHTEEQITTLGLKNSSAKLMPVGTLSIAMYGATIGRLGVMAFPAATNQACANVIPDSELIDRDYLFFYLLSERKALIEKGQGGAQPNISQEVIKAHPIVIAPLNEQRRIVVKLERLLGKVDACRQRLAKLPRLLKRFRQAVLAAACSGRLTADWRETFASLQSGDELLDLICAERNISRETVITAPEFEVPDTWSWSKLDALLRHDRGLTYGILKPGEFIQDGVPMLRVMDIGDGKLNDTDIFRVSAALAEEYRRTSLEAGDILLAVMATVGRAMVVPPAFIGANVNRALAVIKLSPHINSEFACAVIRCPYFQDRFANEKVGSAQQRINLTDLREFAFPIPPLAEQQEIVRRVEAFSHLADQLESRYYRAKAHVDKLTQSLLAKAFRGELVPQDPQDEPAAVLLERIRAKRAPQQSSTVKSAKRTVRSRE